MSEKQTDAKQVINYIIDLENENKELKQELSFYKFPRPILAMTNEDDINILDDVDILKEIKDYVFKEWCKHYLPDVEISSDSEELNVLSFEQWNKEINRDYFVDSYNMPKKISSALDKMSLAQIKDFFKTQLQESYKELVEKEKEKYKEKNKEAN